MGKIQNSKQIVSVILKLEFGICLGFGICNSDFGTTRSFDSDYVRSG
jgi:hypothetical protein